MNTIRLTFLLITFLLLIIFSSSSGASTLITPGSVSSSEPEFGSGYFLANIIDQSGLSANYTSGITDFASFTATTTSSSASLQDNTSTLHFGAEGGMNFDFTFDASYTFSDFALWNDTDSQGIGSFSLFSSSDSSFSSLTLLTSGIATFGPQPPMPAQTFSFSPTDTQYLRLMATPISEQILNFGEVAFGANASPIPVPAALWLFGSALLGFIGLGKRKAT